MTISDTICLFDICQSTGSYCRKVVLGVEANERPLFSASSIG
jgi:hypothetical protein